MNKKWMQLRDLFAMQAHGGWMHAMLGRLRRPHTPGLRLAVPLIDAAMNRMDRHTQGQSAKFDQRYGTDTYDRLDVPVSADGSNPEIWGYSAINQDFLREMLRAVPVPLDSYTFVDVGSGKGAAVLMASEFPFKSLIGVELSPALMADAKRNVQRFNTSTGRSVAPEWVEGDFFQWTPPKQACLYSFNNPFPPDLTLTALQHLEKILSVDGFPVLMVFRKAPSSSGNYLHHSSFWTPLRLAPYWRVYAANHGANHV